MIRTQIYHLLTIKTSTIIQVYGVTQHYLTKQTQTVSDKCDIQLNKSIRTITLTVHPNYTIAISYKLAKVLPRVLVIQLLQYKTS